jgi:hypothetical protein
VIPPRGSLSEPSARPEDLLSGEGDLINFDSDEPSPQEPSPQEPSPQEPSPKEHPSASGNRPPLDPSHPSTADVQKALDSTGSHKEGPLIDFHDDMKRDLPASTKPTGSTELEDEFLDAQA